MGENTVEVLFKTRAELAGARQFADELERQIGKLRAQGKDVAELEKQLEKVRESISKFKGATPGPEVAEMFSKMREGLGDIVPGFAKLDGIFSKFSGGALGALAGTFAAAAAGIEAAKHAVEEFANAEEHVAKLDAALSQAGLLTDAYRERLQELAQELQKTTTIADDEWLAVLTRLTQFGADPANIERYADAVKNLSGLLGGDVQSAANLFSRALQGNFEMFGRYGITVAEAGSQTQRLNQLMEELAQRGGGQLEAAGRTLNGQWRDFKNTTADVSKGVGRMIADMGILQGVLNFVQGGFEFWAEKLDGAIGKVEGLENAMRPTTQSLTEGAVASKAFAAGLKDDADRAKDASDALNGFIAKLKEVQRLQDELADANMAEELAQVDDSGATGSDALRKKAGIRKKYAQQKFDRGQDATRREIDLRQGAYTKAAGEVLGFDQAVKDAKEQAAYQHTIENTEFSMRGWMQKTAEARKAWEKATMTRETERSKLGAKLGIAFTEPLPMYDDEVVRTKQELEFSTRNEQRKRDELRALKGAPGLTGKSAAQLDAEVAALEKKRAEAEGRLGDADKGRQGNGVLREQLQYNERIFKKRTSADDLVTDFQVRKEDQKTAEQAGKDEQRRLVEQVRGATRNFKDSSQEIQDTIVGGFQSLAENQNDTARVVQDIVRELNNLKSRTANLRTP